jgi:PST family polysaccharide transporter
MTPFDSSGAFGPVPGGGEVRGLAVRSAAATLSAAALSLVLRAVSTVVLARLLTPAEFGVVTMVTTFSLLLASFGLNGFTEAIIQFEKMDHYTASNLFWLNSGAGLILAAALAAAGPLLARFYRNPLVANVAAVLSLGIFVAAVGTIHSALLKRAMRFTVISAVDGVALVAYTVVSIMLALRGWRYWALVAGIVASQLSTTIGVWWLCQWIPSSPRRTDQTGAVVRFAAKVYGQFSLLYSIQNIDNLLVGWRFNAVALGFYKRAYDLFALTAAQLTTPLNNVALAALSRLNQDHRRFRQDLARSVGMIAFAGMAMSADLTLVGRDVVKLVLGPKWSESGEIFEVFGPGIGVMLLYGPVGWIHLSIGKPGRWLRWTFVQLALTVSLFLAALPWGPLGVAAAWSISYWTLLIPGFWYAGRPIGFGVAALFTSIWKYVAAALAAGLVTAGIIRGTAFWGTPSGTSTALVAIILISTVFVTLYLGTVILFHRGLAPLRQVASLLRELTPSRRDTRPAAEPVGGYK